MVSIRKYCPKDFEDVHRISLSASSHPDKTGDDLRYHFFMYTDYYLLCQSDVSFVAEDENGKVIGYLLCAKDYDEFYQTMHEELIPQLENEELQARARLEVGVYSRFKDDYAAHLHIDIDPHFQHGGVGSKLMSVLIEELKSQGINGVMLGVAAKNTKAIKFYEKNGFHVIEENEFVKMMGIKLNQ